MSSEPMTPPVGQPAPDFRLASTGGQTVSLDDFKGKQNVVLYFYPRDDTPGCTKEACAFRDLQGEFAAAGAAILGVSGDDVDSHEKFASKFGLPFPLLADTDHDVSTRYGTYKLRRQGDREWMGIERTTFWVDANGAAVPAFTQIVASDVRAGRFRPRDAALTAQVVDYLEKLERGGRYQLMVWPVHCVTGTWGHNLHADVAAQVARWEAQCQRPCLRILKGLNSMTEQYSAVQAEVPVEGDPRTQPNSELIEFAMREGPLLVAGEAASHCVAATMRHLLEGMTTAQRARVVLLTDCMSPVGGFEAQAQSFQAEAAAQGVRLMTCAQALNEITRR